jgi:hypothetical protein
MDKHIFSNTLKISAYIIHHYKICTYRKKKYTKFSIRKKIYIYFTVMMYTTIEDIIVSLFFGKHKFSIFIENNKNEIVKDEEQKKSNL